MHKEEFGGPVNEFKSLFTADWGNESVAGIDGSRKTNDALNPQIYDQVSFDFPA